jgi:CheY-like chemotaxis protein
MNRERYWLLVEDDVEDQRFFLETLHNVSKNTGCYVASNGEEALFALTEEGLTPDIIFTDLSMPKIDGLQFLKLLRGIEKFEHTPVVIYTSHFSDEQIRRAKELRVSAIYSKTGIGALGEILKRHLSGNVLSPL